MLKPGVVPGSNGPLLYEGPDVARNTDQWNNMPLVLEHPMHNGKPLSARSPKVLERFALGSVYNAKVQDGKLTAEAWFDIEKTSKLRPDLLTRLGSGQPIECSTGLFLDVEPKTGVYNDREYKGVARKLRADHLAILPDGRGACSVKDGCGVLANSRPTVKQVLATLNSKKGPKMKTTTTTETTTNKLPLDPDAFLPLPVMNFDDPKDEPTANTATVDLDILPLPRMEF